MRLPVRPLALPPLLFAGALIVGALAAVPASAAVSAVAAPVTEAVVTAASATSLCPDAVTATFGPDVCVFTPAMSQSAIQADLNAIATQQVPLSAQFDSDRYSVFFEPGTYGSAATPLVFEVGYYTEVAGLGALPSDTTINGQIEAFPNALDPASTPANSWADSTVNFWRSMSNLTLNVMDTANNYVPQPISQQAPIGDSGNCYSGNSDMWSVSQAAPMRSVIINGNLVLQAYCTATNYGGTDYASGGYIANSQVNGNLDFYGNQQYFVRNSSISGQANGCGTPGQGLWNNVFSGVVGAPAPVFTGQCDQNTVLAASPVTEEEPFPYVNASGQFQVFVPSVQANSSGTSWSSGTEAGKSLPLSSFFIATPGTSVAAIDVALLAGKNLILTPGVYNVSAPIVVSRPDTVVLGLGFATLVPQHGIVPMVVAPNTGVKLSGLIFDAGAVNSPALLSVGTPLPAAGSASDPDTIQDVFFRVGGAETTSTAATVSLLDNASNSILDDVWAWRADHGNAVGWTQNKGDTGVVVTGNNVTAYGLAVEHYQKSEVVWAGQGGTDVFFQNELPYDVPSQSAWNESSSFTGYPAFQVAGNVKTFTGYGMGSYVVFTQTTATLHVTAAFQAPLAPGVTFNNVFGLWIGGSGGLNSVVNGTGGAVTNTTDPTNAPIDVASYSG